MGAYLRKLLVSFVVAALLIVAFHRALAESDLVAMPALVMAKQEAHIANCENIHDQYAVFQKRIVDDGATLEAYSLLASVTYLKWYEALAPAEKNERAWPEKYFTPIELGATRLEKSSTDIYAIGTEYETEVNRIGFLIKKCFVANEARARVLHDLDLFLQTMTESQSTSADFFGQMQSRLRDGTKQWRNLETKRAKAPADFFKTLKDDSDIYAKASAYLSENAALVSEKYQPIVDGLSTLTPVEKKLNLLLQ